ncbi:MAG TPA: peptide-methionine (S)-S-oxide reductase MsrA [Crenotrichaceae bacterium]|nr:peptide-methionine (S)-S-oxide reductase MsrA [Crenotrichaceae bacterium]
MSVHCDTALPGRWEPLPVSDTHYVNQNLIVEPFPTGLEQAIFGMGCFWGPEKRFWELHGVYSTSVGYSGGCTPHPLYKEVCTGNTGHAEVVKVVFDPAIVSYESLLRHFWQTHDPTQGMRQGNDSGSQYRSVIFTFNKQQQELAESTQLIYQKCLTQASFGKITTIIRPVLAYYYAEMEHQQYLAKNPHGYCGLNKTGVIFAF